MSDRGRLYKNKFIDTTILKSNEVLDRGLGFHKYYKNKYPPLPTTATIPTATSTVDDHKQYQHPDDLIASNPWHSGIKTPDQSLSMPMSQPPKYGSHTPRYNKPRVTTVTIDSANRDIEKYPEPNHYKVQLNSELINIKSIRLKSTEIPNTAQVINDSPETYNTSIYWVDLDDIDQDLECLIYEARLDPGNYTATTLAQHIQARMNLVNRFSNNTPHEFIVTIDTDTDIANFQSISSTVLGTNPLTLTAGTQLITVSHPGHTFRVGDNVVIVGSTAIGALTSDVINSTYEIITTTEDTYDILVGSVSAETVSGGGSAVSAGVEKPFMFLYSNINTPGNVLGFPQQDSSDLLAFSIDFIDTAPPDLDTVDPIDEHPAGTAPAWIESPSSGIQPGDTIKIRGTDCIPDINGINRVTLVSPDANSFEIGRTVSSGTVVKVVNRQTIYENTSIGNVIESLDTTHRYVTGISSSSAHYFVSASPHNLTNFSDVYIAYTDLVPVNTNGPHAIDNIIFNPPAADQFTVDVDITANLGNTPEQEFVEITQLASYAISRITRANNGTVTINNAALASLGTPFYLYFGLPLDPAKTPWSVPDLNSATVGGHEVIAASFPGATEAFSDPNTVELATVIQDVTGNPSDREVVIMKGPGDIYDIASITESNTGFIATADLSTQIPTAPNTEAWNLVGLNNVYLLHTDAFTAPTGLEGYHADAITNSADNTQFQVQSWTGTTSVSPVPSPFRPAWITSLETSTQTLDAVYAANNGLVRDTSMSTIYLLGGRNVTFDSMSPQVTRAAYTVASKTPGAPPGFTTITTTAPHNITHGATDVKISLSGDPDGFSGTFIVSSVTTATDFIVPTVAAGALGGASVSVSMTGNVFRVDNLFPSAAPRDSFDLTETVNGTTTFGDTITTVTSGGGNIGVVTMPSANVEVYVGQQVRILGSANPLVNNSFPVISVPTSPPPYNTFNVDLGFALGGPSAGGTLRRIGQYTITHDAVGVTAGIDDGQYGIATTFTSVPAAGPGFWVRVTTTGASIGPLLVGDRVYIRSLRSTAALAALKPLYGVQTVTRVAGGGLAANEFDIGIDLSGGPLPVTDVTGIADFIRLFSGVTSFFTAGSVTPSSGFAFRVDGHPFGAVGGPTDTNVCFVNINSDPVTDINNPLNPNPVGPTAIDPTAPRTVRLTTDLEIIDQDLLIFNASSASSFTGAGDLLYRTTSESDLGSGRYLYTRTNDEYAYFITEFLPQSNGAITTTAPHGIVENVDKVYIEGPDVVTTPAGGIQRTLYTIAIGGVISPTQFQLPATDINSVVSSAGKVVVVNNLQTSPYLITQAARHNNGLFTTTLDLDNAAPPSGGIGYPAQFDVYVANAALVTNPANPTPSLPAPQGESLKNLVFRVQRFADTLNGTSTFEFEPIGTKIIGTSTANPCVIETARPHGLLGGATVAIKFDTNVPDATYTVGAILTTTTFEIVYDNTAGTDTTPYGLVAEDTGVELFTVASVPEPPTFPLTIEWANADVTKQPIKIADVVPSSNGRIELDSVVGMNPAENVYIEGTNVTPTLNGIRNILAVYPGTSEIELQDFTIDTVASAKSSVVGLSYQSADTGRVVFDVSQSPATTFLLGEQVTLAGHSVAGYNSTSLVIEATDLGKTVEVSGIAFTANGTGGTMTANTLGRLIRTPSNAVVDITDITESTVPAVFTAPEHGFSTGTLYFFNTNTTPSLEDAADYGIRTDATIVDNDTFSIPESLIVNNRVVVLQNPDSRFTKEAIRTQTGAIESLVLDPANDRTIVTTTSRENPNKVVFAITESIAANPGVVNAPGHTFSNGDLVEIINHKSTPTLSGPYKISNAVAGSSFTVPVEILLGSPVASGYASGPAEPYAGHGLRSASGDFGIVPFAIDRIIHSNPARVVLVEDRTIFCGERLTFQDNSAMPPAPTTLPTPITPGVNEFAVIRIFADTATTEFLINYDATLQSTITNVSIANPSVVSVQAPTWGLGDTVDIRFDANVPDGVYTVLFVGGPNDLTVNLDNSAGTNVAPYGFLYDAGGNRYQVTNVSVANPAIVSFRSHSMGIGENVVIAGDINVPSGTYAVSSLVGTDDIVINYDNSAGTNVAPYGTISPESTSGGSLYRQPVQVFQPVIVTSEDHGLYTGYEININGSDTVPSIDGRHRITRIDEHTFSILNNEQPNQVAGETGSWTWGNQVVLHNVFTDPSITDIIYDVTVLDDNRFSVPVVPDVLIDVRANAYWGTNVLTVQYKGHGLASGDILSVYLAEDVGGVADVTINTVHGEKRENVETITEMLSRRVVTILDIQDTDPGSPTFGQIVPNPDEFQIFASGYHITFTDLTTGGTQTGINSFNKSPNRLLDAYAKETVIGGGFDMCVSIRTHNTLELINGFRNYGFASVHNNILCNGALNRVIDLAGENYIYMLNPVLSTVTSSGEVRDIFAKVLLSEPPGSIVYNSFISTPKYFDVSPLPRLAELELRFVTGSGRLFDFNGVDHSFSLEVESFIDVLEAAGMSERRGTVDYYGASGSTVFSGVDLQRHFPKSAQGGVGIKPTGGGRL